MPISAEHALRRGMISGKAYKGLTRMKGSASMGPKGKMVNFNQNNRVDEHEPKRGQVSASEINAHAQQKTARVGGQVLGKGGPRHGASVLRSAKGGQPTSDAINESTGKRWPGGSEVRKGNARQKNRGNSGGSDTNGPAGIKGEYYGSRENNRYG